jgi:hypothetical protein
MLFDESGNVIDDIREFMANRKATEAAAGLPGAPKLHPCDEPY